MKNYKIDIRHQYKTWKILPGFYISDDQPVEIQRIAFLKDQVSSKYSLQLKLRLSDRYVNTGLKTIVLQGSLLNSVQDVIYTFTLEYKNIEKNIKYFGTKNIVNVPAVADYVRVDSIKFVCNDETSQVHTIEASSFNQINIEYSEISESGKYANEVLFKPARLDNRHWICSCGTLNEDGESCGTCGNTFEQARLRIDPEHIRQVEDLEKSKREVEKQARAFGGASLQLKIIFTVLVLFQMVSMLFDRIPVFLRYDRDDIQAAIILVGITLVAHIASCLRVQTNNNLDKESYGKIMQTWLIIMQLARVGIDISQGRDFKSFLIIDGIYIVAVLTLMITYKSSVSYNRRSIVFIQVLAIVQFIQCSVYAAAAQSAVGQMQTAIGIEQFTTIFQAFIYWAEVYLVYFIQLSNRAVRDLTIRFDGRF